MKPLCECFHIQAHYAKFYNLDYSEGTLKITTDIVLGINNVVLGTNIEAFNRS